MSSPRIYSRAKLTEAMQCAAAPRLSGSSSASRMGLSAIG